MKLELEQNGKRHSEVRIKTEIMLFLQAQQGQAQFLQAQKALLTH